MARALRPPMVIGGVLLAALLTLLWLSVSNASDGRPTSRPAETQKSRVNLPLVAGDYPVPPPPFSEGIFPCSDCHSPRDKVDKTRRVLKEPHQDIVLRHDEEHRWCLDCHSAETRDVLRTAAGDPIKFTESYKLCGQCHGDKYRDWRAGVHGKRTGEWNGRKTYLLCVHCHDPHAPKYKGIAPLPPPVRPEEIK